jgi:Tol biopolymer transport system component
LGDKIEIHTPSGSKIASFEGSFTSPVWSPDGSKILFRENSSISPCIWDINLGTKRCIREIERKHPNANSIAQLGWSKDDSQIYYLYYGGDKSGLCSFNLINGNDSCPIDGLSELGKLNVERYEISADEKYFVFHFGNSCAGCDFWSDPTVGIISRDGTNFYTIGKEYLVSTPYTFSYPMGTLLWRPKPTFTP